MRPHNVKLPIKLGYKQYRVKKIFKIDLSEFKLKRLQLVTFEITALFAIPHISHKIDEEIS